MANIKPRKRGRGAAHATVGRVEEHPVPHPPGGSIVDLPLDGVRRYCTRYELPIAPPATFAGFLLGGPVGKLSKSHKQYRRSSYPEASKAVLDHLHDGMIRENDAIAEFLYSVQHRNQVFKLRFGRDDRRPPPKRTSSQDPDAMETAPAAADAAPPHESHIPLPVEPLSTHPDNDSALANLPAQG